MRRLYFATLAGLVVGCATGYRDSYDTTPLGNGRYIVETGGNAFTDRSTVIQYAYRRAGELCPMGFDIIDADKNTSSNDVTFDGGKTYTTVNKSSSTLLIQCKVPAPTRPVGWWCTVNGELGACLSTVGECEAMRGRWNAGKEPDVQLPGCGFQQIAICAPSGCRPTPASCSRFERAAGRNGSACSVQQ